MQDSGESDSILHISVYICGLHAYTYIYVILILKNHSFDLKLVNTT